MNQLIEITNRDTLKHAAKLSGHGRAFYLVVASVIKGAGYTEELSSLGISNDRYPEIARECVDAFNRAHGSTLLAFRPRHIKKEDETTKHEEEEQKEELTFIDHFVSLKTIIQRAALVLNNEEFFVLMSCDLLPANKKKSFSDLSEITGKSSKVCKSIQGRAKRKLKSELTKNTPDFSQHPFLRKRRGYASISESAQYIVNPTKLDQAYPEETQILFMLSSTLFEARHHYIVCNEFLYDTNIERDRKHSASFCGMTKRGYIGTAFLLLDILKDAVTYEENAERLLRTLDEIQECLLYKGATHSLGRTASDKVDERYINLKNPDIIKIYKILLRESCGADFVAFCVCDLYGAEHKLTVEQAKSTFGYSENTIRRARNDAKSTIKEAVKGTEDEYLLTHPFFRKKDAPSKIDARAKVVMRDIEFQGYKASLNNKEREIYDLASLLFNPRQFYCFTMSQLFKSGKPYAQIDRDIEAPDTTAKLATKSAKAIMDSYFARQIHANHVPSIELD